MNRNLNYGSAVEYGTESESVNLEQIDAHELKEKITEIKSKLRQYAEGEGDSPDRDQDRNEMIADSSRYASEYDDEEEAKSSELASEKSLEWVKPKIQIKSVLADVTSIHSSQASGINLFQDDSLGDLEEAD